MADSQCLKQVHSFEKLSSLMRHNLTLLHGQILDDEAGSSILPKIRGCEIKICTVPIHAHGISEPKLDWHLPKLGRMCCNPEKIARKNGLALPQ